MGNYTSHHIRARTLKGQRLAGGPAGAHAGPLPLRAGQLGEPRLPKLDASCGAGAPVQEVQDAAGLKDGLQQRGHEGPRLSRRTALQKGLRHA